MIQTLTYITVAIVALLVLILVLYLILIIFHLYRGANKLKALAGGLQKIAADTAPLKEKVEVINGALTSVRDGLGSVDGHLITIAKVLKLV